MEKLPEEILLKIFDQLPVESLRRVARVCQSWLFILHNAPNIVKKLKLTLYFTDTNVQIIDELQGAPHQNLKICGLNHRNFDKLQSFINPALTCSVRKLKLVNCNLRRYSSYKQIVEMFLMATHVTFECCTVEATYYEHGSQDVGPEEHQNDFKLETTQYDSRKFNGDSSFVAMALFVTHLEILYSDAYLACVFTVSPLKYLRHGGFGDPRVIFMMLWSCPDLKELHVFEYSKNFVNFCRKFDDDKDCPSIKNRLEKFTVDHMYDHYLTFEQPLMTFRQLKRTEPLAMISFLQSQRESLREMTIMNCPSNGDLVLMSSILKIEKLELGIESMQEIQGALNFERVLSNEMTLKELKLHGDARKMRTLKAFVSQFKDLSKVSFINSDLIYIDPRELSTTADPKIIYTEEKTKKRFNTIPTREIGIYKNDVQDHVEVIRRKKVETRNRRRLKCIQRIELKNARDFVEVIEL